MGKGYRDWCAQTGYKHSQKGSQWGSLFYVLGLFLTLAVASIVLDKNIAFAQSAILSDAGTVSDASVRRVSRPVEEVIRYISGDQWTWIGRSGQRQYRLPDSYLTLLDRSSSGFPNPALAVRNADTLHSARITGISSVTDKRSLLLKAGLYLDEVPLPRIQSLIQFFEAQRSWGAERQAQARRMFLEVLSDGVFCRLAEQFAADGGRLSVEANIGGYYHGPSATMRLGVTGRPLFDAANFAHELLHYAFDKMDAYIYESNDPGGSDHFLIQALEDRVSLVLAIRAGQDPLDRRLVEISATEGFTIRGKLNELIPTLFRLRPWGELRQTLFSDTIQNNYVESAVIPLVSHMHLLHAEPQRYSREVRLQNHHVSTLAFLHAMNGQLLAVYLGHVLGHSSDLEGVVSGWSELWRRLGSQVRWWNDYRLHLAHWLDEELPNLESFPRE